MDIHQSGFNGLDGFTRDGCNFWIGGSLFNLAKLFYVSHAIHANDILINFFAAAPARCGGTFCRRRGACAVTDFADALHGTSACNAALHGCLKGVGLARQCHPFSCSTSSSFCCVPARRRGFSSDSSRLSSAFHCRSFSSRRLK